MSIDLETLAIGTKLLTRCNNRARLLATDVKTESGQTCLCLVTDDGEENAEFYYPDGCFRGDSGESDYDIIAVAPPSIRVRVVIGGDDGKRYVLSATEDEERFATPAERFLTCDRILADTIVEIPLSEAAR